MKTIELDLRRALAGRWFFAAVLTVAAVLWMDLGWQAQTVTEALQRAAEPAAVLAPNWTDVFHAALCGDLGLLLLPVLSSLPFAAQALTEIRTGAFRPAVFRAGRWAYVIGKTSACAVSGAMVQLGGFAALWLALEGCFLLRGIAGIPPSAACAVLPLLAGRMLCGGLWACTGCAVSLLTDSPGAAYLAPLCLCYALRMIGTRFFPQAVWLDASSWPTGHWTLPALALAVSAFAACAALHGEVTRHA